MKRKRTTAAVVVALATLAAACSGLSTVTEKTTSSSDATISADPTGCADVIDVVVIPENSGTYRFDVTVRSADTGEEKYADLWEVRAPDGTVLGERVLTHPHVDEQPFTRSRGGIHIPAGIATATVVARDTVAGFCGEAFDVDVR
jgi:hypothetical protein